MIVATREVMSSIPGVVDTVRERPDMLAAAASRDRMELTGNAITLAADAAESIQPRNSLEKMLAHQLAASHRLGMKFIDKATTLLNRFDLGISGLRPVSDVQANSVEAARLANAAARMMASYHDGLLVLDRIRRGGRQTVTVVHQQVAVANGGQAVVAGTVKGLALPRNIYPPIRARAGASSTESGRGSGPKWRVNRMHSVFRDVAGLNTEGAQGIGTTPHAAAPRPARAPLVRAAAMANSRCRMDGGKSTGPRTPEGIERIRASRTKHGRYSAASIARRREARSVLRAVRELLGNF